MTSYQPNIPTGLVDLDQDYLNVRGNFQQLNTTYGVDHVAYSVALNNGYHKALHLIPQSPPGAVPGIGELYSQTTNDGVSTGQQLFYQFINGSAVTINTPLTMNFLPTVGSNGSFPSNGYTFLPGGFIMQWGIVTDANITTGTATGTATFSTSGNIAFPNSCFVVIPGTINNSPPGGARYIGITITSKGKTTFNWSANGSSSAGNSFSWTAIGN